MLKLSEPIQNDVDLGGGGLLLVLSSDHQEALTVRADGIIGAAHPDGRHRDTGSFEKQPGLAGAECERPPPRP